MLQVCQISLSLSTILLPSEEPFFSAPNSAVDFRNPQRFGKITGTQGVTRGLGASKLFIEIHFKLEF